jgi:hypothetical protein
VHSGFASIPSPMSHRFRITAAVPKNAAVFNRVDSGGSGRFAPDRFRRFHQAHRH